MRRARERIHCEKHSFVRSEDWWKIRCFRCGEGEGMGEKEYHIDDFLNTQHLTPHSEFKIGGDVLQG